MKQNLFWAETKKAQHGEEKHVGSGTQRVFGRNPSRAEKKKIGKKKKNLLCARSCFTDKVTKKNLTLRTGNNVFGVSDGVETPPWEDEKRACDFISI